MKVSMFGIYQDNKSLNGLWFNAEVKNWVLKYQLDGNCLFPTYDLAFEYLKNEIQDVKAEIHEVAFKIDGNYEHEIVHLPCDVEI